MERLTASPLSYAALADLAAVKELIEKVFPAGRDAFGDIINAKQCFCLSAAESIDREWDIVSEIANVIKRLSGKARRCASAAAHAHLQAADCVLGGPGMSHAYETAPGQPYSGFGFRSGHQCDCAAAECG